MKIKKDYDFYCFMITKNWCEFKRGVQHGHMSCTMEPSWVRIEFNCQETIRHLKKTQIRCLTWLREIQSTYPI